MCSEQVCEGVGWICGVDAQGNYAWHRSSAPCDDGNPCTSGDLCVERRCVGRPKACDTPPANSCQDSSTLLSWDKTGLCDREAGGECIYTSSKVTCPKGCSDGQCIGSPCTGVKCNAKQVCRTSPGRCVAGTCVYDPLPQGTACTSPDACTRNATCDGAGNCKGTQVDCKRPHTTGGTCVSPGGTCQGYKCDKGWGNCNKSTKNWSDGCETPLTSTANCGACGVTCGPLSHANPSCASGSCKIGSCQGSYRDCDKKVKNGCEILVGVANKCSDKGIVPFSGATPPCGTAYCGSAPASAKAKNFGTWYCLWCPHCTKKPNGEYAWCLSGNLSLSSKDCNASTNCGCNPDDPKYPQKCPKP